MRTLLRSPFVVAVVTGVVLIFAVFLSPASVLVAGTTYNTVVADELLPTLVPTFGPPYLDLLVSSVEPAGDPCQSIRNELDDLSPGDFMNLQAYVRARAQLVQQLRACENAAGYGAPPPPCPAGTPITFTVHVRNIGTGATLYPMPVLLNIDGVPTWTAVGLLAANGGENTATIGGIVLASGDHTFTVTVNPRHEIWEPDYSNNTFDGNDLLCA